MKNPYVVLAEKEQQAAKLKLQIAALRMAAPLIADDEDLREAIAVEKRNNTAFALAAEAAGKMPRESLQPSQPFPSVAEPPTQA